MTRRPKFAKGDAMHHLDRPVFHSLAGAWAEIAVRHGSAVRQDRAFGPFAAAEDPADLIPLLAPGETAWLVETMLVPAPAGLVQVRTAELAQMVRAAADGGPVPDGVVALGPDDADEIRALAGLTKPGPFHAETHRIGAFLGLRAGGRLVAMAGERMRVPGFAEVSGVCTHPDHRGRGLAAGLMRAVCARIVARGETPFLHSYAANAGANALYERLGFATRRIVIVTELGTP